MKTAGCIANEYEAIRSKCEQLAFDAKSQLEATLRQSGVPAYVTYRCKSVPSFVRKALFRGVADPLSEIRDKSGVRVVVQYREHLPKVVDVAESHFEVVERQNKSAELKPWEFGYRGMHLQCKFKSVAPKGSHAGYSTDMEFELQIRTTAEDIWAIASHELDYKSRESSEHPSRRQLFQLQAMLEVFDERLGELRQDFHSKPEFLVGRLLTVLEERFYKLSNRMAQDWEVSFNIVRTLLPLLDIDHPDEIVAEIDQFLASNESKLILAYRADTSQTPAKLLLEQPESLLAFLLIEQQPARLRSIWEQHFPPELMEALAREWGSSWYLDA